MLAYVLVLALLAPSALVSAQTGGIRGCDGGRPPAQGVTVEGCANTPCDVFQGSDAIMHTNFRTARSASLLRPQVYATALGQTIEYTLPPQHQNACDHLTTGSCPMNAGEDGTWRFAFPITSIYPPIPVTVQLTMYDHINEHVFCALIDIHVRLR